jgi:hypothetical protein
VSLFGEPHNVKAVERTGGTVELTMDDGLVVTLRESDGGPAVTVGKTAYRLQRTVSEDDTYGLVASGRNHYDIEVLAAGVKQIMNEGDFTSEDGNVALSITGDTLAFTDKRDGCVYLVTMQPDYVRLMEGDGVRAVDVRFASDSLWIAGESRIVVSVRKNDEGSYFIDCPDFPFASRYRKNATIYFVQPDLLDY